MVARLWNHPSSGGPSGSASPFPGAVTVGSTEACLLAGLALKFRWRAWMAQRSTPPLSARDSRKLIPELIICTTFQAAWEKFFRYFDVDPVFVTPSINTFFPGEKAQARARLLTTGGGELVR